MIQINVIVLNVLYPYAGCPGPRRSANLTAGSSMHQHSQRTNHCGPVTL